MNNSEDRRDLLRAVGFALENLARLNDVVLESFGDEHILALSDAQEVLAQSYTRANGKPLEGICRMCGRPLHDGPDFQVEVCWQCECSYGPAETEEAIPPSSLRGAAQLGRSGVAWGQ